MYYAVALLLLVASCVSASAKVDSETDMWEFLLYQDASPSTFAALGTLDTDDPKDYRYGYNLTGSLFRRSKYPMPPMEGNVLVWYDDIQEKYGWASLMIGRAGIMVYRLAVKEMRKHIPLRFLYMDNLEYEVGYIVYQVFHKYQMMLEVYDIAYRRFYLRQEVETAPVKYMVYLYLRMFKLSFFIVHLCNMAHEMHKKYVGHDSIFTHTDAPLESQKHERDKMKKIIEQAKETGNVAQQMEMVNKKLRELEKAKKKKLKRERKRQLIEGMVKYEPTREPTRVTRE